MSLEDGTVLYNFERKKKPTYSKAGATKQAQFVELREPGMSHLGQLCKIKQTMNGLILHLTEVSEKYKGLDDSGPEAGTELEKFHEQDSDQHEENAKQLAQMLEFAFGMADADMSHFMADFQKMACNSRQSSICVLDNEQVMTQAIWETLDPQDAINIALRWAAFFTMPLEFHQSIEQGEQSEPHTAVKEL